MFKFFKSQPDEPARPKRTARGFCRACNVYCHPEMDRVIVASVYNHGGLLAEKPGGATLLDFSDSAALNTAVRAALDVCEYEEDFDYSDRKMSDWPAYEASGYKTMKRFEAEFISLLVQGVNEKNHFYHVTTPEFGAFGLRVMITVDAHTGNYGEAMQCIVRNYMACKAAIAS